MESIGVRELRQHASRFLARVAKGETIQVTDRGRPVAMLVPTRQDRWHDLIAAGDIAEGTGDRAIFADAVGDYGIRASERLQALRDGER